MVEPFLESTDAIDWREPSVLAKAKELSAGVSDPSGLAERCFLFVRDEIKHCWDHQLEPVTFAASEVLRHGTGWCYGKAHLLAALLRANGLPAGLCYQRLATGDSGPPFCLHGLNAVRLPGFGWYRLDARGNKEGIDAQFAPPSERLAFSASGDGERDFAEVWSEPHPLVQDCLRACQSNTEVRNRLPDLPRTSDPDSCG